MPVYKTVIASDCSASTRISKLRLFMNVSVLIIGDSEFSKYLRQKVRGLSAMSHWQVDTSHEAEQLLASETADILLIQASRPDSWELCHILKQKRHLVWSYGVLVDRRPSPLPTAIDEALQQHTELAAIALETGADAYLWLPDQAFAGEANDGFGRLLQAHLKIAMQRLQSSRELIQANDLLSSIALVDSLTQLGNRRALDWELPRQIEAARAQDYALSLLMLDIDHFKHVNDRYGHLAGDQVLRLFSDRLRQYMRYYETPFRYGGEEFVVLLQNTSIQEATKTAERLRQLIGEAPFGINNNLEIPLTVSIGIAALAELDDAKGTNLIARSDANLLRAKKNGRNQIVGTFE